MRGAARGSRAGSLGVLAAVCLLSGLLETATAGFVVSMEGEKPVHSAIPHVRGPPPDNYYTGESANVSRLLDSLLKGYDKRLRPNYKVVNNRTAVTGPPVEVGITMYVSSVSSISEVDMDFTLDFYFRQTWMDPRLRFPDSEEELCISNEMLAKIWWPDTFFANAKVAKFHTATTQNAFLRIKPNGQVLQSLRLTVTAMCRMDLVYFPMDSQICSLEIESYGYSVKDIKYSWHDGLAKSVGIDPEVQLPQFKVKGFRAKDKVAQLTTGNYSRLSCELYFVRSLGYYVIQIYVPSMLIVVMSWVSFWLSREAVPARVALGITTVLTMTTLISSTNASLPKISYLKSIDVYLVTCFVMVFASILEYAAVSYLSNRSKRKAKRRTSDVACTPAEREKLTSNGSFTCRKCDTLPASDPLATEVRLTSLRKLHTECDLRSLSGGSGGNYFSLGSCRHPHCRASDECKCATPPPPPPPEHHAPPSHRGTTYNACQCITRPSNIDKYSRILFPLCFLCFNILYWIAYLNISHNPEESHFVIP